MIRGPNVTPGYWNRPEANRESFTEDGWFHTGDAARVDEDGYFYIVDRWKDMFISGGENVYPVEVENAIYELDGVLENAVVGIADEKWARWAARTSSSRTARTSTEEQFSSIAGIGSRATRSQGSAFPRRAAAQRDRQDPQARAPAAVERAWTGAGRNTSARFVARAHSAVVAGRTDRETPKA